MTTNDPRHDAPAGGPNGAPDWSQQPPQQPRAQAQAGQQQWTPPQPTPRPAGSGFFNSIRYSGWFRAEDRVIGGVCSGIAAKTGWDVGLVRGLTVVLGLLFGPVLIAYGLAWALLPEQRDGRIHLEQLFHGRGDVAQLGAFAFVLMGLGNPSMNIVFKDHSIMPVFYALFVGIALITAVVVMATRSSRPRTPGGTVPPTGAPMTGTPMPPQQTPQQQGPASFAAPQRTTPQPQQAPQFQQQYGQAPRQPMPGAAPVPPQQPMPQQPQQWVPPQTPANQTPHLSSAVTTSVIGGLFLILAAIVWWSIRYQGDGVSQVTGLVIGAGAMLILVGAVLVGSAARGKRALTLIVLSVIGICLWPFAVIGGANHESFRADAVDSFSGSMHTHTGPSSMDWQVNEFSDWTGPVTLDLTAAPKDQYHFISMWDGTGPVEIRVRPDQAVSFELHDVTGTISSKTVDGGNISWVPQSAGVGWDGEFHSPQWRDGDGIEIEISDVTGPITIKEVEAKAAAQSGKPSAKPSATPEPAQSGATKPQSGN